MRKISIILSAVIALLILAVLATPFGMGIWIEKRYPQIISQFNTPHLTLELINLKRGWFRSKAQLRVTFHSAETTLNNEANSLIQVTVEQNIQHGPVVNQKDPQGRQHWVLAKAAMENFSHEENLNFTTNTLWTMSNSINTNLNIQRLLIGNERQRIEINQLLGTINFTPTDQHFRSQLTLTSGALYENNPEKAGNDIIDLVKVLELNHLNSQLDIYKIQSLWYGKRHFTAQQISIFPYAGEVIHLTNIMADLNQDQKEDLTNFNLINQVESITNGKFKIDQLKIALALKDMNNELLEKFAQVFMRATDFQKFKLYSLLIDLFAKGMTIDLNQLQFITENGPVNFQAQFISPTIDGANSGLLHLLENLQAQASANIPQVWLKNNLIAYYENKKAENPNLKIDPQSMADQYMSHWLSHHLLIPQENQVTLAIIFKDGKLLINGEKPSLNNIIFGDDLKNFQ